MGTEGLIRSAGRCRRSGTVAEGWRSGADDRTRCNALVQPLLEMAGVGSTVLDIATGTATGVTPQGVWPRARGNRRCLYVARAGRGAPMRNINFIEMTRTPWTCLKMADAALCAGAHVHARRQGRRGPRRGRLAVWARPKVPMSVAWAIQWLLNRLRRRREPLRCQPRRGGTSEKRTRARRAHGHDGFKSADGYVDFLRMVSAIINRQPRVCRPGHNEAAGRYRPGDPMETRLSASGTRPRENKKG